MKNLYELELKDNYMFYIVMSDLYNCRKLLEMILQIPIRTIEPDKDTHKGSLTSLRMSIIADDEKGTPYVVEMEAIRAVDLPRKSRFFHSLIDHRIGRLEPCYDNHPNSVVIFLCDSDPFGDRRYKYTFRKYCMENASVQLEDLQETIILSAVGENPEDISEDLVRFLEYFHGIPEQNEADIRDPYIRLLHQSVRWFKYEPRVQREYMALEAYYNESVNEDLREKLRRVLNLWGTASEEVLERIRNCYDQETLTRWINLAVKVASVEKFEEQM